MATVELTREEWLAERKTGVGASEAAAIFNQHPYKTPLELYLDKKGMLAERPPTPRMVWGLRMEPVVAAAYAEETGREITKGPQILRHPDAPWMMASLDYLAPDRPVEIKRISQYAAGEFGPTGSNEVPLVYFLQVQQQMACTGLAIADLAALIGHDDFRVYTIERNDEIIGQLMHAEREFMDRVEASAPPLPDFAHPATADLLAMIEPDLSKEITLGPDEEFLAICYDQLGATERDAAKKREEVKAKLIHAMGAAGLAFLPNGRTITRKPVTIRAHVRKESSFCKLTISKE